MREQRPPATTEHTPAPAPAASARAAPPLSPKQDDGLAITSIRGGAAVSPYPTNVITSSFFVLRPSRIGRIGKSSARSSTTNAMSLVHTVPDKLETTRAPRATGSADGSTPL